MSVIRSTSASRPADSRTSPSPMPSAARSSGLSLECVVVAGWVTRLFESPRLLEMSTRRSASRKRKQPSLSPDMTEGDDGAAFGHLAAPQLVLRMARQAGIDHPADLRVGFEKARERTGRLLSL